MADQLNASLEVLNEGLSKILDSIQMLKTVGHGIQVKIIDAHGLHGFDPDHPSLMARTMCGFLSTVDEFTQRALQYSEKIKEIIENEKFQKQKQN